MKEKTQSSKRFYFLFLLLPIFIFFSPVWLQGRLPIPADTIVGMYHPLRDVVWNGLTAGVPFKNFLITDAVRQQYPWRELAIDLVKQGQLPLWNPYTFSGTPLLANIQTAVFYPLNLLYLLMPFNTAWTVQVISQPILLAAFMFLYLQEIGLSKKSSALASLTLTLSGFSVAWFEWNTTLHTLVWLPLGLLAVEKLMKKQDLKWYMAFAFSIVSIIFAGFLQTAFYALFLLICYALFRGLRGRQQKGRNRFILGLFVAVAFAVLVTSIQWIPTLKLIAGSARAYDQGNVLEREDWFLPWQNLVQFIAPDFFGNPATLNYWGTFNYLEFVGYIGIAPLALALLGLFTWEVEPKSAVKNRSSTSQVVRRFFTIALVAALLLATPNPISRLPFQLHVPLLSSAQPSRLMMIIDLSLAVFVAFGADRFFRQLSQGKLGVFRSLFASLVVVAVILLGMWTFVLGGAPDAAGITVENLSVARRNLVLPTALIIATGITVISAFLATKLKVKSNSLIHYSLFMILFLLTSADLVRFAVKFTPFTDPRFLYPSTATIEFLKSDTSLWRYMTTDARILPPNFSVAYRLQTIEGYDPIYSARYGQLIASAQRNEPVLEATPFHRIIRPDNFESPIFDLLNVKYILALADLEHPKLTKVFEEGKTRVYENRNAFPRAFLIQDYSAPSDDRESLEQAFALKRESVKEAAIEHYSENSVRISAESDAGGMLVLADTFYPGWSATLDGSNVEIRRVLYGLRGTMIPPGKHEVLFSYSQF